MAFSGWHVETGAFMMHKGVEKQNLQVALWCQMRVAHFKRVLSNCFSNILNPYSC